MLRQNRFCNSIKAFNLYLFEAKIVFFNHGISPHFSSSHSPSKENRKTQDGSKSIASKKTGQNEAFNVNAPPDGKKPHSDGKKKKNERKIKTISIKPNIGSNDFQIKMKQMQKFIDKGMIVAINVDNPNKLEQGLEIILSQVEKTTSECPIPPKITVTGHIINIFPKQNVKSDNAKDSTSESKATDK